MLKAFRKYLENEELSKRTRNAYITAIKQYIKQQGETITKKKLLLYKDWLIENFKPKSVNVKIAAINCFLKSIHKSKLSLQVVKIQQKTLIENILSKADYKYMKTQLRKRKDYENYFLVWLLCTTGARISEFCLLKVENIQQGYFDIYGKGKKYRRIYIPKKVQAEALKWLISLNKSTGPIFTNSVGNVASPELLRKRLKNIASDLEIDPTLVYPHSFRHLYARLFLEKNKDIGLLADLMGHTNIETTRIYTRQTAIEQREMIDSIVDW